MTHETIKLHCCSALITLFAAGCVGAPGETGGAAIPAAEAHAPAPAAASKLLWSEAIGPDHRVSFYELSSGDQATMEEGDSATTPRLEPALIERGLVAVYAQLVPGAVVPEALVASDKLRAGRAASTLPVPLSPALISADSSGRLAPRDGTRVHPEDSGENNWFLGTFCNSPAPYDTVRCPTGSDWADSGTTGAAQNAWQSFAYVGHEGSASATYYGDYWSCWNSGFLGLGTTCAWQRAFTDSVPPGRWHTWSGNVSGGIDARQYHANISGAGGGTTVGLVLKYAAFRSVPQ